MTGVSVAAPSGQVRGRRSVLVTGGTGLVGRAVVRGFLDDGWRVTIVARNRQRDTGIAPDLVRFEAVDLTGAGERQITDIVRGHDAVVHLMALTHRPDVQDEARYRKVNVEPTQKLVSAALEHRVESFIYMSSIKALTESAEEPALEDARPQPQDAYGRSKLEAEQVVQEALGESGLAWFIARPPLVYGLGVQGNLQRLTGWLDRGLPMPCIRPGNARSMVSDRNLASFVIAAASAGPAQSGIYHVADDESWSFEELVGLLGEARNKPLRRIVVPRAVFNLFPRKIKNHPSLSRLTQSLVLDNAKARRVLGWKPVESSRAGLMRAFSDTAPSSGIAPVIARRNP